jgi:hypothetical protein
MLSGLLVNLLSGSHEFTEWLKGNHIETKHMVGGVIFTGLALLLFVYLQFRYERKPELSGEKSVPGEDVEVDIKRFVESARTRYQHRYEQKLDGRFEITLEIYKDGWNEENSEPVTDRFDRDANSGLAALKINETFHEKKRLLIVGSPGAGKTVLLLKLALSLLESTPPVGNYSIPVIFNLASWSPKYKKFEEWLASMLVSGEGLSVDLAEHLLQSNRIIFLLDGLDELFRNEGKEIAAKKRAACLASLTPYFRKGRQNVICCRNEEFVQIRSLTRQNAPVSAIVSIKDLTREQIDDALIDASHKEADGKRIDEVSANNLRNLLQEKDNRAFSEVLRTPFYFTTALEVFDQQNVRFPKLPRSEKKLKKYLLDKFVDNKLDHTSNPNNFDCTRTKARLVFLARLMEKKQLISFELADLQPSDLLKRWLYTIFFGVATACLFDMIFILYMSMIRVLSDDITYQGFLGVLIFSSLVGFFLGMSVGSEDEIKTEDIVHLSFSNLFIWERMAVKALLFGLSVGAVASLFFASTISIGFGVIFGLLSAIAWDFGTFKNITKFAYLKNPYQRIYGGFMVNLTFVILVMALVILLNILFRITYGIEFSIYLIAFSVLSIFFSLLPLIRHTVIRHAILRVALRFESLADSKYVTFLNYADSARILERDGGHWRFRHQNLQDYFADLE